MSDIVGLKHLKLGVYEEMSQAQRLKEALYLSVLHAKEFKEFRKVEEEPRKVYLYLRSHHDSCQGCIR